MNRIQDEWEPLTRIIKMIAEQFGSRCEVVLHDLTNDYNNTIVAIENGEVTNRVVGGSGSNLGLQVLAGNQKNGDVYNYITRTKSGKTLRSSTTYIKNEKNEVIGAICVNYDISDLMMIGSVLDEVIMFSGSKTDIEPEVFANNVSEILDHLTVQCQEYIGKSPEDMAKEDKIRAIEYFDSKGAFLISKAGEHIRDYLMISKYTLYNYLEIARSRSRENGEDIS